MLRLPGSRARERLATVFQWAAAVVGLAILGGCSAMGIKAKGLSGVSLFFAGLVTAILLAGWILLVAGLCKDVIAIRRQLAARDDEKQRSADAG